jgi:hypothetical protein
MPEKEKKMDKFDFLLGSWNLDYRIPKSAMSEAGTASGTGTMMRVLKDKYVFFDYTASGMDGQKTSVHGIFTWDEKAGVYRYWWFEDSGNFLTATCNFINDKTLFMSWHDTLLTQTFTKKGPDEVVLRMEHPSAEGMVELVLEVLFTRE